jgi:hypothetical protein
VQYLILPSVVLFAPPPLILALQLIVPFQLAIAGALW